jgi:hypothetical protein
MGREKHTIFNWEIPENIFISGAINCSRKFGGCGRWHSFEVDERGEIEFDLSWENSKGEFECEKFSDWLEEEVREEWESELKERFLQEQEKSAELVNVEQEQKERVANLRAGVRLEERQFEKEWGAVRPVGFRKKKLEIFVCGNCSVELKGAGRHGKAKNRNNPLFWGLEVAEKVLCGNCLEQRKGAMPALRRKEFNRYWKEGMFR